MNGYVIAGFLLVCVVTGLLSYRTGYANGRNAVVAKSATQQSTAQTQAIQATRDELAAANSEATRLRQQAAKLEVAHAQTTAQLRHALATNRELRSCLDARVPADILQQLTTAGDSAARRAATGTADAAVPSPNRAVVGGHHE